MRLGKGSLVLLLGILVSAPVSIWGVTIRDDQPDSSYQTLATSPEYAAVGTFVSNWGYTSSATLIAPDWILTSAHSLTAASSGTFTINGISYASTQLIANPGWNESNPFGGYDFGLVHLSSVVGGITPAELYTGTADIGQIGTFVGYGAAGTGLTGWQSIDNQKRAFQNVIDGDFGNPSILLASDFDNPHNAADNGFGSPTPLTLEGCVAPGDSGGGVFITIGSQTYLEGVISFVASIDGNSDSDYGDASGFGRVSAFTPWIISTAPEPSVFSLLGVGAGLGLFSWRRSRK